MGVWFTSDLHLGHLLVARHRGFGEDVVTHDVTICERWSAEVKPKDDVWVLGDLSVSSPGYALSLMADLPGRKHLIAGNHDQCHPMHRNSHKMLRRYLDVFESVQPFARRRINGEEVLLSHFPYEKDRGEPRYTQYRLRDEGKWLLHGHTHDEYQQREGREIHVGLDAWALSPVPLAVIEVLMQEA